jgi:hypothetical protein
MYNIITLEVLENHTQTTQSKLFGHKHVTVEYKKGDKVTTTHSIGRQHQELIEQGKLKVVKDLFQ